MMELDSQRYNFLIEYPQKGGKKREKRTVSFVSPLMMSHHGHNYGRRCGLSLKLSLSRSTREGYHVTDVGHAGNKQHETLESKAET